MYDVIFYIWKSAVTWLKYCKYGVKLYPIDQSIHLWIYHFNEMTQRTDWLLLMKKTGSNALNKIVENKLICLHYPVVKICDWFKVFGNYRHVWSLAVGLITSKCCREKHDIHLYSYSFNNFAIVKTLRQEITWLPGSFKVWVKSTE